VTDSTGVRRSGYVGIAGLANSGKSSLLNALAGRRISPCHRFRGTTRVSISAICTTESSQICLIDTPPLEMCGEFSVLSDVDAVIVTMNSMRLSREMDSLALKEFLAAFKGIPRIAVPTFIDYFPSELRQAFSNQLSVWGNFESILPVCAPCNQNVDHLLSVVESHIPERGRLFPEGCSSLHSERFLVSEQIRISLFKVLPSEIAASTAVQIEEFSIRDEKRYVRANLHVARHASKGVVIGKRGAMLQNIAEIAAAGSSDILERPLYLDLWVKVRESWPDNADDLLEFGYVC